MCPIYKQWENSNYLVSVFGTIRTKDKFKLIKSHPNKKNGEGHLKITICHKGKRKSMFVHRMVAILWVPKPYGKHHLDIVNHDNTIKTDNFASNLEWTTIQGNTQHAYDNGLIDMAHARSFRKINHGN